jgi:hypothetical protein
MIFFKDFFSSKNLKLLQQGYGGGAFGKGVGIGQNASNKIQKTRQ